MDKDVLPLVNGTPIDASLVIVRAIFSAKYGHTTRINARLLAGLQAGVSVLSTSVNALDNLIYSRWVLRLRG